MFKFRKKDKTPARAGTPGKELQKEASGEEKPAKRSFFKKIFSLKFIVIFLILILIIGGASFAGWFFFLKKHGAETSPQPEIEEISQKDSKDKLPPAEPDFPDIVDLEPFEKIRLQESESLNFLTLKISIELIGPDMRNSFESNSEQARKIVESEAQKMTWLVLRSPEGKLNFKYRLIKELNGALPLRMVQNVYFTTFILQ